MELRWNRLFLVLWAALILYSLVFAPGSTDDTLQLLKDLLLDPFGVEPMVLALFNLMGVLPMAYSAILLFEGREKGLRSWPFVLGSFFAGAFSILLYLGLRRPQRTFRGKKGPLLRILDSRAYGVILKLAGVSLIAYGLGAGDPSNFLELFNNNMLVHVMTLDFLILTMALAYAIHDDMIRRGWTGRWRYLAFGMVPLIGPLTYIWARPSQIGEGENGEALDH
ncbi:MAG: DUF2834 domain-containing protein [Candidatus Thermoplasmatota archaeon]|nr:DUF2834 domain-containing protein [Candidatus Thermoplasmatota archaeon]